MVTSSRLGVLGLNENLGVPSGVVALAKLPFAPPSPGPKLARKALLGVESGVEGAVEKDGVVGV